MDFLSKLFDLAGAFKSGQAAGASAGQAITQSVTRWLVVVVIGILLFYFGLKLVTSE